MSGAHDLGRALISVSGCCGAAERDITRCVNREDAMGLKGLIKTKPVTIAPGTGVLDACEILKERQQTALAVVDGQTLRGLLTERDLILHVLLARRDPREVTAAEVMTRDIEPLTTNHSPGDALRAMVEREENVLPVVEPEENGRLVGMLSLTELLEHEIDHLANELDAVTNYFTADGAGGD
jgi:CBS domain-containing protein